MMPDGRESRPQQEAAPETPAKTSTATITETKRAAAVRRRTLAGLRLSWWLHSLDAHDPRPADPCENRCGALDLEARKRWSERGSCPCKELAS
jgi:hypothetical protein